MMILRILEGLMSMINPSLSETLFYRKCSRYQIQPILIIHDKIILLANSLGFNQMVLDYLNIFCYTDNRIYDTLGRLINMIPIVMPFPIWKDQLGV